jgi:hypothetical protein
VSADSWLAAAGAAHEVTEMLRAMGAARDAEVNTLIAAEAYDCRVIGDEDATRV